MLTTWVLMAAFAAPGPDRQPGSKWMTLPLPCGYREYPRYFAPDAEFPRPRELASLEDPEGAAVRAGGVRGVVPAPVAPAAPIPVPAKR